MDTLAVEDDDGQFKSSELKRKKAFLEGFSLFLSHFYLFLRVRVKMVSSSHNYI